MQEILGCENSLSPHIVRIGGTYHERNEDALQMVG
jgi:hypothetical protein